MTITLSNEQVRQALAEYMVRATPSAIIGIVRDAALDAEGLSTVVHDRPVLGALADRLCVLAMDIRKRESAVYAATRTDGVFSVELAASIRKAF